MAIFWEISMFTFLREPKFHDIHAYTDRNVTWIITEYQQIIALKQETLLNNHMAIFVWYLFLQISGWYTWVLYIIYTYINNFFPKQLSPHKHIAIQSNNPSPTFSPRQGTSRIPRFVASTVHSSKHHPRMDSWPRPAGWENTVGPPFFEHVQNARHPMKQRGNEGTWGDLKLTS